MVGLWVESFRNLVGWWGMLKRREVSSYLYLLLCFFLSRINLRYDCLHGCCDPKSNASVCSTNFGWATPNNSVQWLLKIRQGWCAITLVLLNSISMSLSRGTGCTEEPRHTSELFWTWPFFFSYNALFIRVDRMRERKKNRGRKLFGRSCWWLWGDKASWC